MRPGNVAVITIVTVVGVNWLAKRSATVRKVWAF